MKKHGTRNIILKKSVRLIIDEKPGPRPTHGVNGTTFGKIANVGRYFQIRAELPAFHLLIVVDITKCCFPVASEGHHLFNLFERIYNKSPLLISKI